MKPYLGNISIQGQGERDSEDKKYNDGPSIGE